MARPPGRGTSRPSLALLTLARAAGAAAAAATLRGPAEVGPRPGALVVLAEGDVRQAGAPCRDAERGETGLALQGLPLSCPELRSLCGDPGRGPGVRAKCPASCGLCGGAAGFPAAGVQQHADWLGNQRPTARMARQEVSARGAVAGSATHIDGAAAPSPAAAAGAPGVITVEGMPTTRPASGASSASSSAKGATGGTTPSVRALEAAFTKCEDPTGAVLRLDDGSLAGCAHMRPVCRHLKLAVQAACPVACGFCTPKVGSTQGTPVLPGQAAGGTNVTMHPVEFLPGCTDLQNPGFEMKVKEGSERWERASCGSLVAHCGSRSWGQLIRQRCPVSCVECVPEGPGLPPCEDKELHGGGTTAAGQPITCAHLRGYCKYLSLRARSMCPRVCALCRKAPPKAEQGRTSESDVNVRATTPDNQLCRDAPEPGLAIQQAVSGSQKPASCQDLRPYCNDLSQGLSVLSTLHTMCPWTCGTCENVVVRIPESVKNLKVVENSTDFVNKTPIVDWTREDRPHQVSNISMATSTLPPLAVKAPTNMLVATVHAEAAAEATGADVHRWYRPQPHAVRPREVRVSERSAPL